MDPGECYAGLTDLPKVEDNCEVDTLYFEDEMGNAIDISKVGIGENTIYAIAEDIHGNKDTCIFDFKVEEYDPVSGTFACQDEINLSLDGNCEAKLTAEMILTGTDYGCYENYCIDIVDSQGNAHPNYFNYDDVGKSFMVTVSDCLGDGNGCMSMLNIVEKFVPELECPNDTVVSCNADTEPESLGVVKILNCEPFAEILHSDELIDYGMCGIPRAEIIRTWSVNDHQGNIVSCEQKITIKKSDLNDVLFPPDVLDLSCDYVREHPEATKPENTGYPTIGDIPVNYNTGLCMLSYLYNDEIYDYCGSSYEILRTWKVRDMCGPVTPDNPKIGVQIIKVFDTEKPVFKECHDISVGASPYQCAGEVQLPVPLVTDNCNDITLNATVNGAAVNIKGDYTKGDIKIIAYNMSLGSHPARFIATDDCKNTSVCEFTIKVEDNTPPIAICEQYKQVSLSTDGVAFVCAPDFDSGSFDNCNDISFKVRRGMEGDFDDCVSFDCSDIDASSMIVLRVYDVELEPGKIGADENEGHYNECMVNVDVACKYTPSLTCENIKLNCDANTDPEANPEFYPTVSSLCSDSLWYEDLDGEQGICATTFIRKWYLKSCGSTVSCEQEITLEPIDDDAFAPCTIEMPSNEYATCKSPLVGGSPKWLEGTCNVVTSEVIREDTFKFVTGACYQIVREWAVIDWCVYEKNTGAENDVDVWKEDRTLDCKDSHYKDGYDGYYRCIQYLTLVDDWAPEIEVKDTCIGVTDCSAYPVVLRASATDTCNDKEELDWSYRILNMDTWEFVQYSRGYAVDDDDPKLGRLGTGYDVLKNTKEGQIRLSYKDGRDRALDIGSYRIEWTVRDGCGNNTTSTQVLQIVDKKAPTPIMVDIATAFMSNGEVDLSAKTLDKGGCGEGCIASFDNCVEKQNLYFTFDAHLPHLWEGTWIKDEHGLYYFDPHSGAISSREKFESGEADAWDESEKVAIRKYKCDLLGEGNVEIVEDVYVWDNFGPYDDGVCGNTNYDFATVVINFQGCAGAVTHALSGTAKLVETTQGVENVMMTVEQNGEIVGDLLTGSNGDFEFVLPPGEYSLSGSSEEDPLNGVSTMDIVMIQKHILGVEICLKDRLDSLAADASNDGRITAADIAVIRKVILGVKDNFISHSWVAVSNETGELNLDVVLGRDVWNADFTVVKVGDLNNTARSVITPRSGGVVMLELEDMMLKKGEEIEIPVYAKDFEEVRGGQFAISLKGINLIGVNSGKLSINASNYNVVGEDLLVSWNEARGQSVTDGEVLFSLLVRSTEDVVLRDAVSVNDGVLRSEVYKGKDLEISSMEISYRNMSYALYQNNPNPFVNSTTIGFELPESEEYTLTIYDGTGKLIKVITEIGKAGYNSRTITKKELNTRGVLYYRLESGDYTSTKKMVILN